MFMRSAIVLLLTSTITLGATAAQAAHCADPADRPAVCTVEAYAGFNGDRPRSFDLNGSVEMQPNQTLEIEIDAFDQNRRRFPKDRLAFDFDANDCRQLAKVESTSTGRIEITTGTGRGGCEVWLWLPGNLNFEWKLNLEIASRARSGYTTSEAEFVTHRVYQALLRRDADPQGLRDTSAAVLRGELSRRIDDILRSEEYRTKARGAQPAWTLEQLYTGVFGRKPDASATQAFSGLIQRGRVADVLRELLDSDEFERILAQR